VGTALVDQVHADTASVGAVHESDLGPGAAVAGSPLSPFASGPRARVISAALRCVSRFGVSKTTVDDIARAAGLSRATLYRLFPGGREQVLVAMVEAEIEGLFSALGEQLGLATDVEDVLVTMLTTSADQLARHEALRRLLECEPEVVLPFVSFHRFDHVLAVAGRKLAPYLEPVLGATQAQRVAEWLTRLVVSHVLCAPGSVETEFRGLFETRPRGERSFALHPEPIGEERARRLVRHFVMPGIHVLTAAERSGLIDRTTE
jgi:AcrR family transcriptional regulator